jgi:hypothetical protein
MFSVSNRDALQRFIQFLINALTENGSAQNHTLSKSAATERSELYQTKYSYLSSPD